MGMPCLIVALGDTALAERLTCDCAAWFQRVMPCLIVALGAPYL